VSASLKPSGDLCRYRYGREVQKSVLTLGAIQAIGIFSYGLTIVISGTLGHSTVGSPLVQFLIYSFFALSIAATTWGISKNQDWARTPFYIVQVFIIISGYTLVSGTETIYKVIGLIVGAFGAAGFIALIRTPAKP
jgi:hypothetical protein